MFNWLLGKPLTPREFWAWFQANAHEFRSLPLPKEKAKAFAKMLARLHHDLGWGIQPGTTPTEPWRLEISAEGRARLISRVEEVVSEAPRIQGWEICAFRQPQPEAKVRLQKSDLTAADVLWVEEGWDEEKIHLTLFIPMEKPIRADDLTQAGFMLLDATLGELMVMTRVGALDFKHISVAPDRARPLTDLPGHIFGQSL
jgi:hypothetical protein